MHPLIIVCILIITCIFLYHLICGLCRQSIPEKYLIKKYKIIGWNYSDRLKAQNISIAVLIEYYKLTTLNKSEDEIISNVNNASNEELYEFLKLIQKK